MIHGTYEPTTCRCTNTCCGCYEPEPYSTRYYYVYASVPSASSFRAAVAALRGDGRRLLFALTAPALPTPPEVPARPSALPRAATWLLRIARRRL